MEKQKRFGLFALAALILSAMFLSSCIFGGGKSQEECLQDYREKYQQRMIDHFAENEDVFNRIAETLSVYVAGADDIGSYKTISLGNYMTFSDKGETAKYTLFIVKQLNANDKNDITREYIDFLNDSTINVHALKEEELDEIFMPDGFDSTSLLARYTEAYCDALSNAVHRGDYVGFSFALPQIYNRADRVDATLWYSKSGGMSDSPDRINDHWYITYSLYWSPAI